MLPVVIVAVCSCDLSLQVVEMQYSGLKTVRSAENLIDTLATCNQPWENLIIDPLTVKRVKRLLALY